MIDRTAQSDVHCLASNVEKRLDVEVIGGKDYLEEHLLINIDELLVPFGDVCRPLSRLFGVFSAWCGVSSVVLAVLQNLLSQS